MDALIPFTTSGSLVDLVDSKLPQPIAGPAVQEKAVGSEADDGI